MFGLPATLARSPTARVEPPRDALARPRLASSLLGTRSLAHGSHRASSGRARSPPARIEPPRDALARLRLASSLLGTRSLASGSHRATGCPKQPRIKARDKFTALGRVSPSAGRRPRLGAAVRKRALVDVWASVGASSREAIGRRRARFGVEAEAHAATRARRGPRWSTCRGFDPR